MTSDIRGVLFDKDGTLFDFKATWGVFCDRMLDALAGHDDALKERLANAVGYDRQTGDFRTGSLIVNASTGEVDAAWADLVPSLSLADVEEMSRKEMQNLPISPVCDLSALMTTLRDAGMKVGVATNDYELGATRQLSKANALDAFDFVCGSDSGSGRKPEPGMINTFCDLMGLLPEQVAFVGDSTHDLLCGKNAKVGQRIAVLTGPATREDLEELASVVLNSIEEVPGYLTGGAESVSCQA